jgi:MarR family
MQRQLGVIDLATGELLTGVPVWFGVKVQSPYGRRWVGMNQHFLEEFAAREDVHGETFRVFIYLNARLDFDNLINVPQKEIAKALNMQQPNVSRAIKKLEELGIILRGPKIGKIAAWRLNPNAGWKGKVKDLRPALHAAQKQGKEHHE